MDSRDASALSRAADLWQTYSPVPDKPVKRAVSAPTMSRGEVDARTGDLAQPKAKQLYQDLIRVPAHEHGELRRRWSLHDLLAGATTVQSSTRGKTAVAGVCAWSLGLCIGMLSANVDGARPVVRRRAFWPPTSLATPLFSVKR